MDSLAIPVKKTPGLSLNLLGDVRLDRFVVPVRNSKKLDGNSVRQFEAINLGANE